MSDREQSPQSDPRKRRLDELFEDEPYLSATMKARRLHEKLRRQQAGDADLSLPTEAFIIEPPASARPSNNGAAYIATGGARPAPAEKPILLHEAASFFRTGEPTGRVNSARAADLMRFRDQVLAQWLEGLPRK